MSKANRLVVVAGVGCPKNVIEQSADDLCSYYQADDAAPFTYYQANHQPEQLVKAMADRADVVTHSAGMIAVTEVLGSQDDLMGSLVAMVAPMPTSKTSLVMNSRKIMTYHLREMLRKKDKTINRRHRQMARAYGTGSSLKDLPKLGTIASFNSIETAKEINSQFGQPVGLVAAKADQYFPDRLGQDFVEEGVAYCEVDGGHEESLINPVEVLGRTSVLSFIREHQS